MDALALALVLTAALLHAGWNRLLHDTPDRVAALAIGGLVGGGLLLPATVATPPRAVALLIVLSALAQTCYALSLSAAYRRGALSLAYPIGRGSAPLVLTVGGWLVLAQRPTPGTAAGALALAIGLILVATAGRQPARRAVVFFSLLTGASIATYSLIDAQAVRLVEPVAYLGPVLVLEGLILCVLLRGNRARLRAAVRPGVGVAVGSTAAYLLILVAFQHTGTARVVTLRELSVLIGLLLARDKPGVRTWVGAAVALAGMALAAEA